MPIPIILPKFGFTLETAEIIQWLKKDGDSVRSGEPICEVTTDKVNMEVEAPESGTLISPLFEAGATVKVTEIIAYLLRPGEVHPNKIPQASEAEFLETFSASPVAQRVAEATNVDLTQIKGTGPNNRITRRDVESAVGQSTDKLRATPAARHLAKENRLDLKNITGSGPQGRIQAVDVQTVVERNAQKHMPIEPPPAPVVEIYEATEPSDGPRIIKMEGMRRTIAHRLQHSFQNAPHIFFDAQIDTTGIDGLRQTLKGRKEKLSVTAIVVKACAGVLMRHPWLNATLDGEEIALWPTANIGIAVALDQGLVVPVIHHAERLSMQTIQLSVDDVAKRARENTLKVNDMVDGTFTISNLGMYGVDRFTAIINPPQVAILAVGRTQQLFVPDAHRQPVLRSFITVTLSADHRVVDGAHAANFLQDLRTVLEEPALLAW